MKVSVVFCVLVLAMFYPWWGQGKVLAPLDILRLYQPWLSRTTPFSVHNHMTSDGVTQFLIYRLIADRSFHSDGFVGWSDLTFGGRPEYRNTMACYFDWSMQLHRFLPFWAAWHIGLMGQCLIAGFGMIALLANRGLSAPVSLLASIVYALNSQFLVQLYFHSALGSFCWIPWLVWALFRYRGGHVQMTFVIPVFLCLAFLGGNLQYAAFVVLALSCAAVAWWRESKSNALRIGSLTVAWIVTGLALASFSVVPAAAAFLDNNAAGFARGTISYRLGLTQPLRELLLYTTFPFPSMVGSPASLDFGRVLTREGSFGVAYFGFLPVIIAFTSLFRRATSTTPWWFMVIGLVLPLTPLEGVLYNRVLLLFVFGGVWAFAEFWEFAEPHSMQRTANLLLAVFLLATTLWLLGSIVITVFRPALVQIVQRKTQADVSWPLTGVYGTWVQQRALHFVDECRIWSRHQFIPWSLALSSIILLRLRRNLSMRATWLAIALVAVELLVFANRWETFSDSGEFYRARRDSAHSEIDTLKSLVGDGRLYLGEHFVEGDSDLRRRPAERFVLPPNSLAAYGIPTLWGYESLKPLTIWGRLGFASDQATLTRAGVTHQLTVDHRPDGDSWSLVYRTKDFDVWRNDLRLPHYLPLRPGEDWDQVPLKDLTSYSQMSGRTGVRLLHATFNYRAFEVPPGSSGLRVSENWSASWQYRTDFTDWRPVIAASDGSMLFPLSNVGRAQRVELRYHPRLLVGDARVAAFMIGSALLAFLTIWRLRCRDLLPHTNESLPSAQHHHDQASPKQLSKPCSQVTTPI